MPPFLVVVLLREGGKGNWVSLSLRGAQFEHLGGCSDGSSSSPFRFKVSNLSKTVVMAISELFGDLVLGLGQSLVFGKGGLS